MSAPESQQYLLDMCTDLRASELVYNAETTVCPIDEFRLYLNANAMDFPYEAADGEDSFASVCTVGRAGHCHCVAHCVCDSHDFDAQLDHFAVCHRGHLRSDAVRVGHYAVGGVEVGRCGERGGDYYHRFQR